jgi:hypothetical protein
LDSSVTLKSLLLTRCTSPKSYVQIDETQACEFDQ